MRLFLIPIFTGYDDAEDTIQTSNMFRKWTVKLKKCKYIKILATTDPKILLFRQILIKG